MMQQISFYYLKYKSKLLPVAFLLAASIILLEVTLPNFSAIATLTQQKNEEQKKLQDLKDTTKLLSSVSDTELGNSANLVMRALPFEKDIAAVYDGVTTSAFDSGIIFSGMSVKVGDIFRKDKRQDVMPSSEGVPNIITNISISNVTRETIKNFSDNLLTAFPLSRITKVTVANSGGSAEVLFYYKPRDLTFLSKNVVKPLSTSEKSLLEVLQKYQ